MLIPPPEPPSPLLKWLGLGISIPSTRHNIPREEFPRTTISLLASLVALTPANERAIRAGSLKLAAKRCVSSVLKFLTLFTAASLVLPFLETVTSESTFRPVFSIISKVNSSSFPEDNNTLFNATGSWLLEENVKSKRPTGTFSNRKIPAESV